MIRGEKKPEFEKDFEMELGQSSVKRRREKLTFIWNTTGDEDTGGITSSPLKHKDIVIFGCMDNYIYALDIETGKVAWKFRMAKGVADARAVEGKGIVYMGSFDTNVYAINVENGEELWRFKTGGKVYGSCTVGRGRVYFGSQDSYIYALDAATGKEVWRFRTGAEVGSCPTFHRAVIYAGSYDENLYALDAKTGRELWRFRVGGNISNPLPFFIEDGIIYVSSVDGNVYAVDIERKRELWRFRTGGWMLSSPKPFGEHIYFVSTDGNLYCINKEGKQFWRFMTDTYMDGSPEVVIEKGVLYYGSSNGNFYALNAGTGRELWRFRTDGPVISCPLIHRGRLYFGSCDCHLYCIDARGRELWRFQTSSKNVWEPPPESELFDFEVEVPREQVEEASKDYGRGIDVFDSPENEYDIKSEYAMESEYRTKSEYM